MKLMTAEQLKAMAESLGADLCGIASVERFQGAPAGYRPGDIFPGTRSVVVLAKRLPESAFYAPGPIPYTFACETVLQEVYRITCSLSIRLQEEGITAVPVPSEPYEYWDSEAQEGRGILSLRHAGRLTGLGAMGKNNLLTNREFGNRIELSALLLDAALEQDPLVQYRLCPDKCALCLDSCPARALTGTTVIQKRCRERSIVETGKGYSVYGCRACRTVCPHGKGIGNAVCSELSSPSGSPASSPP